MTALPDIQTSLSSSLRRLWQKIKKYMPLAGTAAPGHGAAGHLERLARTAPHLLADLGFEPDRHAGNAERKVWRRGAFVVSISRDTGAAAVRVEHGRSA